jgi:hypothetical protein
MENTTKARPSKRYVSAARVRRDKINARRGTAVATTTGVIGEGELGGRGWRKVRDKVTRNTIEGERRRIRRVGDDGTISQELSSSKWTREDGSSITCWVKYKIYFIGD